MRLVVIESPYAGDTPEAIRANVDYGRRCLADSLSRGEAPFASHLLYTQPGVLDDANPGQRSIGIAAGLQWSAASNLTAVYYDRGLSKGMKEGLRNAMRLGLRVELRSLNGRETLTAARCPDGSGYELRSPNWQAALLGAEVESFVLLVKNWVDGELASSPRPEKRPHLMDEMKAEAEKIETAQLVRLGSAEMWDALDEFAALFQGGAAKAAAEAESDAGRLALELECLLLSISDMPAVSRWWESANEALDLHRSRLDAIRARGAKGTKTEGDDHGA